MVKTLVYYIRFHDIVVMQRRKGPKIVKFTHLMLFQVVTPANLCTTCRQGRQSVVKGSRGRAPDGGMEASPQKLKDIIELNLNSECNCIDVYLKTVYFVCVTNLLSHLKNIT